LTHFQQFPPNFAIPTRVFPVFLRGPQGEAENIVPRLHTEFPTFLLISAAMWLHS
jgi:hypothetical protein